MNIRKATGIFLALVLLLTVTACSSKSASIGIIGGADGPTTIFVSGPNKDK